MEIKLGLKENLSQFIILIIVNSFVGGMIGLERSILPQIAEAEFHIAAKTAILSFIVVFGIVKALTNYYTGVLSSKIGRKNLLIIGWLIAIPVPFILMWADHWNWIIVANVLLGIHQGLTWSSTVVMKMDLVGQKDRGLAMGLNEFAGYLSVAIVAFATGFIASHYGLRPYPFYIGIFLSIAGLLASWWLVKDTRHHVAMEAMSSSIPRLNNIFWDTTLFDRNLGSVTQAGVVNNLNDGMVWGLLPILLAQKNFSIRDIAIIVAVYPAVWGIGQLFTGRMSDFFCKKSMLFWGMFLQGIALILFVWASTFFHFVILAVLLGWGTAMVYPTFLATIAEHTHPHDRPKSLGVFRLWRDMGYAMGAILTGIIADAFGLYASVMVIGILTLGSAILLEKRMKCRTNSPKLTDWMFNPSHPIEDHQSRNRKCQVEVAV
ncbi:MAG: MFS transporter [Chitinophagaceae bacterium]|nr:MFS transporter [Chitinophagaceae bacterium]